MCASSIERVCRASGLARSRQLIEPLSRVRCKHGLARPQPADWVRAGMALVDSRDPGEDTECAVALCQHWPHSTLFTLHSLAMLSISWPSQPVSVFWLWLVPHSASQLPRLINWHFSSILLALIVILEHLMVCYFKCRCSPSHPACEYLMFVCYLELTFCLPIPSVPSPPWPHQPPP